MELPIKIPRIRLVKVQDRAKQNQQAANIR